LALAGRDLTQAIELANEHAPDTPGHQQAWILAESAIEMISRTMHSNASRGPVEAALRFRITAPGGRANADVRTVQVEHARR
jgi:hypothetical protein